jgi:hypothetical protein
MKYEQGPPIYPAKPTGSILARVIGDGRVFYGVFDSRLVEPHGWAMTSPQLLWLWWGEVENHRGTQQPP